MLKAAAVALALSTTAPVTTVEDGAKPVVKQQEATTQIKKVNPCKNFGACDLK